MARYRSIRIKLLLAIIPILALFGVIATALTTSYLHHSFRSDLEQQQFTLVTLTARKLDDQFAAYQQTLISFSQKIPRQILHNPTALERYIAQRPALREIFDSNVLVFSPEGVLLAEAAQRPSRTGMDFSFREYIKETRRQRKPVISQPFESTLPHHAPVVMLTVPVFDQQGKMLAIIGGSINLLRPNLLGSLATTSIGKEGYFYLTTADRIMIMHPDPKRLLRQVAPPGVNRLYDKALGGFEGAGETVNSAGVAMVVAFKRLETVNWILAAQIPVAEAYAAVSTVQKLTWIIAGCALLILALLVVMAASKLLAPLQSLTTQVNRLTDEVDYRPIQITTGDELEQLADTFNGLLQQLHSSHELYQLLSDFSQDWIFWRSADSRLLYVSPAAEQITGYAVDELMADPTLMDRMIHPADRVAWHQHVCQTEQGNPPAPLEVRIITQSGTVRWLRHNCTPIFNREGQLLGVRGSNRDITERKQALLTLQENEERFRLIADTAHDAIIMSDADRRISFWNSAAERLFGTTSDAAIGTPLATYLPGLVDAINRVESIPDRGLILELSGRHSLGHMLDLELSVSWARIAGSSNTILLARDIAERKQAEERLQFISSHDTLTGLYNRAAFERQLKRLDHEGPFPAAVIMADLDGLKQINDSQGHESGDRLIQAAAELLASSFRNNDIVARIGGDEFAVLLPGIPHEMAQNRYERLQHRIELFSELPENPTVSLSCGMVEITGQGETADALRRADQLMYQQKFARKQTITPS